MSNELQQMRLSTKLRWSFGLIVGMMIGMVALSQYYLAEMRGKWYRIEQQVLIWQDAELSMTRSLGDGVHHFKNYLLRGGDYDAKFREDMRRLLAAADQYQNAGGVGPEARQQLDAIRSAVAAYHVALDQLKQMKVEGRSIEEQDRGVKGADKPISEATARLGEITDREFEADSGQFDTLQAASLRTELPLGLLAVIGAAIFALRMERSLMRQLGGDPSEVERVIGVMATGNLSAPPQAAPTGSLLDHAQKMQQHLREMIAGLKTQADQVGVMAQQLAVAARQISANVQHESEAVRGMAVSIEEMSDSSGHISEKGGLAKQIADRSRQNSGQGVEVINRTVSGLLEVAEQIETAAADVSRLGGDASHISEVVQAIREIADQTNLLALNAAIEAARAGEQGRGFAVVADEVRKLAERTANATAEISQMSAQIGDVANRAVGGMGRVVETTRQGVRDAEVAQHAIADIRHDFDEVSVAIDDISGALTEQNAASIDLTQRTEDIARMSGENFAAASSLSLLAAELEQRAAQVRGAVEVFRV